MKHQRFGPGQGSPACARRVSARRAKRSSWRQTLILVAAVSLAWSLATRYCMTVDPNPQGVAVKSHSPDLKRQHLVNGHSESAPLVAVFEFFQPGPPLSASFAAVSTDFRPGPQDSLYNRPPPFF